MKNSETQQDKRIDPKDSALLEQYLQKLLEINESINLTAVRDYDKGMILHIEDSLAAMEIARSLLKGRMVDIGSGCGFPGVALALALQEHCDLVDSLGKKMKAIDGIIGDLGLNGLVTTNVARIEEYSLDHKEEYNLVTARALASIRVVLELAAPLLERGGHLLLYKSSLVDEELSEAEQMMDKVGMSFMLREDVRLSNGDPRSLVVYEKTHEPSIALPRRIGKAQKSPLK